jgi:SAM-dependent methyltransferase
MDKSIWDRRYADHEFVWTVQPNQFLVQEVQGLRPGHALDLACGEGRNAVWLAERGWRVTGVDLRRVRRRVSHRPGQLAATGAHPRSVMLNGLESLTPAPLGACRKRGRHRPRRRSPAPEPAGFSVVAKAEVR